MKVKTNTLTGRALDYAVCASMPNASGMMRQIIKRPLSYIARYSTGHLGDDLIDRERISVRWMPIGDEPWVAHLPLDGRPHRDGHAGPTRRIAAMRAWVTHKLGETVDIPDELLEEA